MTTYILYHDECFDGLTAAWIANTKLQGTKILLPCKYGQPAPPVEQFDGADVYILDFSFSATYMLRVRSVTNLLQVIDHHKTAQTELEGMPFALFDMNRSGAGLTWDYFYPDLPRPKLVNYVEDRDLWRFKHPDTAQVHAWLASYPKDIELYDSLCMDLVENEEGCIAEGTAILRYQQQKIEEFCKEARLVTISNHVVPEVNVPYQFGSDVCHRLLELYPDSPFASYFCIDKDGKRKVGLRGRDTDDFDVSEVAKMFGGGGHRKAAGYTTT